MRVCAHPDCGKVLYAKNVTGFCVPHGNYAYVRNRRDVMPEGFVEAAPTTSIRQLSKIFGASVEVCTRWRKELGLTSNHYQLWTLDEGFLRANYGKMPVADIAAHLNRTIASVKTRAKKLGLQGRNKPAFQPQYGFMRDRKPNVSGRVQSSADMAAAFIRAHDRTAIYRTDPEGQPNPKGDHWKYGYGSLVLTEGELLAKAERKGWSADEWKKLAA